MSEKKANVQWQGAGKDGSGRISTETQALQAYPYGFGSRFGDDRSGTNPEELLGAAHAACFAMAFSFGCKEAGYDTKTVKTQAKVRLSKDGDGFVIDRIELTLHADVKGLDAKRFQELAEDAKNNCPLSKALASVPEISLKAELEG